jgi:predicted metal-dependent hydrolase
LEDLKSSEIGKTVKKFNKIEDSINNFLSSEIKEILKKLMEKWKNIIKNEKGSTVSSPTESKQKSFKKNS